MKPCCKYAHGGFVLASVLFITIVGLLLGAGALLMFRYQCQIRIDRQHELEKLYAVRSALNYVRTKTDIPDGGRRFGYHTGSGRSLGLIVKPVDPIFPSDAERHYFMTNSPSLGGFKVACPNQYNIERDYEYGVEGTPEDYDIDSSMASEYISSNDMNCYGLAFTDTAETNNVVKWWVNIGMPGTGGWLQEDYGRRYYFYLKNYLGSGNTGATGDVTRLCIIRNVTNNIETVAGRKHGWPLSMNGERALVLEMRPEKSGTDLRFSEYHFSSGGLMVDNVHYWHINDVLCYTGIQLAQRNVSVFSISTSGSGNVRTRPYTFVGEEDFEMSNEAYRYFSDKVTLGGVVYSGIEENDGEGKTAPELRAVIEVQVASTLRDGKPRTESDHELLTDFRVTPAYQYDIFLEHPASVTNLATVAQRVKLGKYNKSGTENTVRTYDTHGTANRGFRKDERDFYRNNGGANL